MRSAALLTLLLLAPQQNTPIPQHSGTDAGLRGLCAVSSRVAWASGTKGTIVRTIDGGEHWTNVSPPNAANLDFRGIKAFDDKTAYALSAGPGEQSRIYKTNNGGHDWRLQFTNREALAFYDCFAFWDRKHGIALSDPVNGAFLLLTTADGNSWSPLVPRRFPPALPGEGAFAASNTCIATLGDKNAWFATGGARARVFHSGDRGETWTAASSPIESGADSQGIFSLLFWSVREGVIIGGDYKKPGATEKTAAFTTDGGATWTLAADGPHGYRSAVAQISARTLVAVGSNGADYSEDGGKSWRELNPGDYNTVSAGGGTIWAAGPKGWVGRLVLKP